MRWGTAGGFYKFDPRLVLVENTLDKPADTDADTGNGNLVQTYSRGSTTYFKGR